MKTINWEFKTEYKVYSGCFEIDEDISKKEIDIIVKDEIWNALSAVGVIGYNWDIQN